MAVDYSAQIAALTAALATGARSVSYEGKSVGYNSFNEMIQALAWLQRQQDAANGNPHPVCSKARFRRGYRRRGLSGAPIFNVPNEDL